MIEQKLRHLFDFQRFSGNKKLHNLIQDTDSRYSRSLSEQELNFVNAAGVPGMMNIKDQDNTNKDDPWKKL